MDGFLAWRALGGGPATPTLRGARLVGRLALIAAAGWFGVGLAERPESWADAAFWSQTAVCAMASWVTFEALYRFEARGYALALAWPRRVTARVLSGRAVARVLPLLEAQAALWAGALAGGMPWRTAVVWLGAAAGTWIGAVGMGLAVHVYAALGDGGEGRTLRSAAARMLSGGAVAQEAVWFVYAPGMAFGVTAAVALGWWTVARVALARDEVAAAAVMLVASGAAAWGAWRAIGQRWGAWWTLVLPRFVELDEHAPPLAPDEALPRADALVRGLASRLPSPTSAVVLALATQLRRRWRLRPIATAAGLACVALAAPRVGSGVALAAVVGGVEALVAMPAFLMGERRLSACAWWASAPVLPGQLWFAELLVCACEAGPFVVLSGIVAAAAAGRVAWLWAVPLWGAVLQFGLGALALAWRRRLGASPASAWAWRVAVLGAAAGVAGSAT